MMGAGATTLISVQWEANDEFTSVFTRGSIDFTTRLRHTGNVTTERLEMIKDSRITCTNCYYWADFTLMGIFRNMQD